MTKEEQDRQRLSEANFLVTRRLMQNIKVANVGLFPDAAGKTPDTPRDERYLTLEVTPDEALILKWLKDAATLTGNIELVLRSPKDTIEFPPTTIDFPLMSRQYRLGTRE
jgi:Flp pilus assembly protein CpaB